MHRKSDQRNRKGGRPTPNLLASLVMLLLFVVITLIYLSQYTKSSRVFKTGQSLCLCPMHNAPLETTIVAATASSDNLRYPIRKRILQRTKGSTHTYLNIFNASEENTTEKNTINSNKCVPLKTTVGNTPICVYDSRIDEYVSKSIVRDGIWERNIVYTVASFLKENQDMQLLDLGCNIGVFTLQAASMGRKVIAVDANKFNLRLLSKSLRLSGLGTNVTLIWNAVSDVHETIKLKITTGNIGRTFIQSEREFDSTSNGNYDNRKTLAITLEDLINFFSGVPLFIKMDIEGSEWRALRGGERFFQQVDVRYVLMEWVHFKHTGNAFDIIRYMTSFDFQPYAVNETIGSVLAVEKSSKWPTDILWVKK